MEIVKNKPKLTLIGMLRSLEIDSNDCLKIDVNRRNSAFRTMFRLKPDYKFTTKTIGSDFYIWRIK